MNWELFRPSKATIICFLLLTASFLLMTFRITSFIQNIKYFLSYWISPSHEIVNRMMVNTQGASQRIGELVFAHHENEILKEKMIHFDLLQSQHAEVMNENYRLRELLSLKTSNYMETVPAIISSRDTQNWMQSISVNKGIVHGISADSAIIGVDGSAVSSDQVHSGVVGRIIECYQNSSKVLLISDPFSSMAISVLRTGEHGLLQGQGVFSVTVEYLNQASDIQEGDLIVTSGLGGVFPSGLPVGKIKKILPSKSGFKRAEVELAVSLSKIREVLILRQMISSPS